MLRVLGHVKLFIGGNCIDSSGELLTNLNKVPGSGGPRFRKPVPGLGRADRFQ